MTLRTNCQCCFVLLTLIAAACGGDQTSKGTSNGDADAGTEPADAAMVDEGNGGKDEGNGGDGTVGTMPSDALEVCGGGWCWVNPRPYGSTLHAVHGAGEAVFMVGSGGTILQRSAGRWSGHVALDTHLYDVFAHSAELAWAAGPALDQFSAAHVHRWDGTQWERVHTIESSSPTMPIGPLFTPAGVWGDQSEAYAAAGSAIHHFDGTTWEPLETPGGDVWVADLVCSDGVCYAVGQTSNHLRFADVGFIWRLDGTRFVDEAIEVGALTSVDVRADGSFIAAGVSGSSAVLAVGADGAWEVSADAPGAIADLVVDPAGTEWAATTTFMFWNVHSRATDGTWTDLGAPFPRVASLGPSRNIPGLYASSSELWFVGRSDNSAGEIARSAGEMWETFTPTSEIRGEITEVSASDAVVAALADGAVHVWRDGGPPTRVEANASRVFVSDDDRVFVVADTVAELTEDGSLTPIAGGPERVDAFFALAPDALFAADRGTVWRWDGSSWTSNLLTEDRAVSALWARAADDAYALFVGSSLPEPLWHFDGTSWQPAVAERIEIDNLVSFTGTETDVLVLGEQSGMTTGVRFDGSTLTSDTEFPPQLTDVLVLPDGTFLLTTQTGEVLRRTTEGTTREPQLAEAGLNSIDVTPSGTIWVGGVSGSLLRYDAP